jgi:hypothetical protein
MTCVIQAVGFANGMPCDKAGQYLESFDPDAYGGRGYVTWTPELSKAMRFASVAEAFDMRKCQSAVRPLRPDGKPNRPLTAYIVEFVPTTGAFDHD